VGFSEDISNGQSVEEFRNRLVPPSCTFPLYCLRRLGDENRFWGLILWNWLSGEFISILKEAIGMATTCETSLEHCQRSFGVECSDRIEAHGAQRRDVAGGERDGGKHNGDAREGGEIGRRHAVEQPGHKMRDDERTGRTHAGAGGGQTEALTQNHP
jgi:hypothetical protein